MAAYRIDLLLLCAAAGVPQHWASHAELIRACDDFRNGQPVPSCSQEHLQQS